MLLLYICVPASVRDAVRLCFRQPQSVLGQAMTEDVRLDMALQSQAQISKWIALLRPPDRPNIFQGEGRRGE